AGVNTLHNFLKKPMIRVGPRVPVTIKPGSPPQVAFPAQNGFPTLHALGPPDYAVIYNINPAYQAGIDGSGTTIAVVGRSNINVQDVTDFRNAFGLSFNPPQVIIDGPDPGDLGRGEEFEAVLDNTWSGALAPNSNVKFVVSYIPENVWNESCTVSQCGSQNANIAAGGGGASSFFSKPSWQSGVSGIPTDGKRDMPDVSLTAALHDPYLVCFEFSCEQNFIYL